MRRKRTKGMRLVREVLATYRGERTAGKAIGLARDVYELLAPAMCGAAQEVFLVLTLNVKNRVTGVHLVSVGLIDASLVHPREVFRIAIREGAASIILAHNHPSGCPEPSPEDLALTRRLAEVGRLVGIEVLDHVVVGDGAYVSFTERGQV